MKYVDDLTCVCVRIRSSKYLPTFSYSSFIEFMLTIGGSFSLLIAPFFSSSQKKKKKSLVIRLSQFTHTPHPRQDKTHKPPYLQTQISNQPTPPQPSHTNEYCTCDQFADDRIRSSCRKEK